MEQKQLELKKLAYKRKKSHKLVKWHFKKKTLEYKNELEFSKARDRKIKALEAKIATREAVITDEFIDKNIRYVKRLRYKKLKAMHAELLLENVPRQVDKVFLASGVYRYVPVVE